MKFEYTHSSVAAVNLARITSLSGPFLICFPLASGSYGERTYAFTHIRLWVALGLQLDIPVPTHGQMALTSITTGQGTGFMSIHAGAMCRNMICRSQ